VYIEVTDIQEIAKAQRTMKRLLKAEFPYRKRRIVGWPSGHFEDDVWFSKPSGNDVSWWFSGSPKEFGSHLNLFGHGDPNDNRLLLIDLQFNFPSDKFSRKHGGAFVRDALTGQIILAHRGIVTRAKSRVPKELLLQEANVTLQQVSSDIYPRNVDVLLVAPIDKPGLSTEIHDFATEIRRAANEVMSPDRSPSILSDKAGLGKDIRSPMDKALSGYFDEFVGSATSRRKNQVTQVWRHGAIVRALRDILKRKDRQQYKSQAIDLAVETKNEVWLFEVKTSSDSQSIYTGIGQLVFHGAALKRLFPKKKIIPCLVLPLAPEKDHRQQFCLELGLKLVSFGEDRRNVLFYGLDLLQ